MSEYGYIPEAPEQSFGNNKGIFTPKDIYDLTRADKYTNYGQLELIETQTFSGAVAQVDFTSLGNYNTHFLTITTAFGDGTADALRMRFFENGVLETGNVYQVATQIGRDNGNFGEASQTAFSGIFLGETAIRTQNAYVYLYNLQDSSKYSFCTWNMNTVDTNPNFFFRFGSAVLPQASTVDGIRIFGAGGENISTAFTMSLYGIKEYS